MKLEGKSLKRDFLRYIIPSIVAQWVFTLYTIVDGIFVAQGVSEMALTAVNISMPFTTALFSVSILFAVGNSTVVAIALGAKKLKEANHAFTQNLVFLGILSVIISALVLLNLNSIVDFLGATTATRQYIKEYVGTIAPFAIVFVFSYSFEMLIKTDGFPKKAMMIVVSGAVLNCILDYIFVMVLHEGVFGAAFATGISQTVVCVLYLAHFLSKHSTLKFSKFRWKWALILREFKNGMSSGLIEFSSGFYIFIFNQMIIWNLHENALVSFSVIAYVNALVVMSMAGIAQGGQPLISYYYGQERFDKCKKLLRYGLVAAGVMAAAFMGVYFIGTNLIISMFISEKLVALREYTATVFRIFSLSYLVVGFNIVIGGYFTAREKPFQAFTISLSRGFILIVLSLFLMTAIFGGEGIWWAPLVSESICLLLSLWFLKRAKKTSEIKPA
ncbi:MAG: MATE family efflux transporter [Lachnospiraceae bacterium]